MGRLDRRRLESLLARFARLRLLVAGDVMLDEYLWGDVDRVSPEAPVPVVHVRRESTALGGAGNVVRNVVAMGARCVLCAGVGDDPAGDRVLELLEELGVPGDGVVRMKGRPTTRKTRVEARAQQMLRFDRETDAPVGRADSAALLRAVDAALPGADGVVLEDYGKGLLAARVLRAAMRRFVRAGVPVAVDPKGSVAPFRGASLFKPNLRELEALTGVRVREEEDLERAVGRLRRALPGADLVVTRGAEGMSLYAGGSGASPLPPGVRVPVARSEVFDLQGAGDTCIASLALGRLAGGSLLEAAVLATAAAAVVVGKVGTATATPDEIRALLPATLEAVRPVAAVRAPAAAGGRR